MTNTCSIKLLKNAHIGGGVRMSSGKDTVPFENVPMKLMHIEKYDKLGFFISHENLPRKIWVNFNQLPLTRLTICNGEIQDEITFVENIVMHQMQLIRTLDTEYMDLLYAEKELDKKETGGDIIPISQAEAGNIYIGAQCKENIPMIYLGTWYAKGIYRNHEYGWGYNSRQRDAFHLDKQSPQRAFFLMDSTNLTSEEEERLETIEMESIERESNEDWEDYYKREDVARKEYYNERAILEKQIISEGAPERWKILVYPVTSKRVKKLIKTPTVAEKFTNNEYNKELIIFSLNREDGNHYGKREDQKELAELKSSYPIPETDDFVIVNRRWDGSGHSYLSEDKNNIDNKAYKFINDNYLCTLSATKLRNGRSWIELDEENKLG